MSELRVYCGNIPFEATAEDLTKFFEDEGFDVKDAKIVIDRDTERSKGFAFVTFEDADAGHRAITQLKDEDFLGRRINLAEALAKQRSGVGPTQAWNNRPASAPDRSRGRRDESRGESWDGRTGRRR